MATIQWRSMAQFQWRNKWMVTLVALIAVVLSVHPVSGCHPSSRELHICLNIYLERDFPLIETIVEGQQQSQGRGGRRRVILEGPDLQNICRHIASLSDCYSDLVTECNSLWQLDRFTRLQGVMNATHHHLCGNGTNNVRDLLLNSGCLATAKTHIAECAGFNWWLSWREVLRMQTSPRDRCTQLESYRQCLHRRFPEVVCGSEASRVYLALIDVWLKNWCEMGSTAEDDHKYLYYALSSAQGSLNYNLNYALYSTVQQSITIYTVIYVMYYTLNMI